MKILLWYLLLADKWNDAHHWLRVFDKDDFQHTKGLSQNL